MFLCFCKLSLSVSRNYVYLMKSVFLLFIIHTMVYSSNSKGFKIMEQLRLISFYNTYFDQYSSSMTLTLVTSIISRVCLLVSATLYSPTAHSAVSNRYYDFWGAHSNQYSDYSFLQCGNVQLNRQVQTSDRKLLPWKWSQHVPQDQQLPTKLHDITSQPIIFSV